MLICYKLNIDGSTLESNKYFNYLVKIINKKFEIEYNENTFVMLIFTVRIDHILRKFRYLYFIQYTIVFSMYILMKT